MTNNDNIHGLPKTEIISYFNEAEWNKDLTIEEQKLNRIVDKSYLDEALSQEREYGLCSSCGGSKKELIFRLDAILKNHNGYYAKKEICSVDDARQQASSILMENGFWGNPGNDSGSKYTSSQRRPLVDKINIAIDEHVNSEKNINRVVINDFENDCADSEGGCSSIM